SIRNPFGNDLYSSSNLSINGELYVVEKACLSNDVTLSSENFVTTIEGNLNSKIINSQEIHSHVIHSHEIHAKNISVDNLNFKNRNISFDDVTINGNITVLGQIKHDKDKPVDLETNTNIVFGKNDAVGSWRIIVIEGVMHIQQHDGKEWITKANFK